VVSGSRVLFGTQAVPLTTPIGMLRASLSLLFAIACGCALRPATPPLSSQKLFTTQSISQVTVASSRTAQAPATPEAKAEEGEEDEDDAADGTDEAEGESLDTEIVGDGSNRYTAELSDEQVAQLWKSSPEQLGSISIGFVDEGRIMNAVQVPQATSDEWLIVSPHLAFATAETVEYLTAAIRAVKVQYPDAPPLRVNQLSIREGGYLRPHKSHQNGRDADLGFYYPTVNPIRVREREKHIDVEKNWALVKALVTNTDVQVILVDRRVQAVIYDYALSVGEDKTWLDSLFRSGKRSIVQHARGHRDHFHVRFYNGRAQELGRRVAPLLALRPDQNIKMHRVRPGDTLGAIAGKYGTSVVALKKANHLRNSFLRISQVLRVPLRGPCTRCPIPPAIVIPERRLPPSVGTEQRADLVRSVSEVGAGSP
jgi:LysM repeat protein